MFISIFQEASFVIEANGHCPHMSHPEEIINTIKSYLSK